VNAASRVISVCELFQSLSWYRGKKITVSGIVYHGLRQPDCPNKGWAAAHHVTPALDLESTERDHETDPPSGFTTEQESWSRIEEAQNALQRGEELWITVTGRVRCSPELPVAGYGHLGAFPAALIIDRLIKLEIKKNSAVDYRVKYRGPM